MELWRVILPRLAYLTTKLPVERLPGNPPGTIVWFRLVELEGAEIGGFTRDVVVDGGQRDSGVNSSGVRIKPEVQIHGVIDVVAAAGVGRRQTFEDVVIHFDAVRLLAGSF